MITASRTVQIIFFLSVHVLTAEYVSQLGQDRYMNEQIFKGKKYGVFVDIGAYDGKTHSNTWHFEKDLQWTGICVEPAPEQFALLSAERSCTCVNACIAATSGNVPFYQVTGAPAMLSGIVHSYDPRHLERMKYEVNRDGGAYQIIDVPAVRFNDLMHEHAITHVDLLSLDTEGSEREILQSIDFETITIHVIVVENNFQDERIQALLEQKGFKREHIFGWSNAPQDELYINQKVH